MLPFRAKALLLLQVGLGRMTAFILAPCYFAVIRLMGYRIRDLRAIRQACRREFQRHEGPWLICANHLTVADSLILSYAMLSLPAHLRVYRWIPWNLPERNNFRNPFLVLLCYLSKCIPVQRGGPRDEMKRTLDKCTYLLSRRQRLLIFPEGGRSRTGRVDREQFSYGVGRFLADDGGDLQVMCLYLRGDGQASYSLLPDFGERFTVLMDVFKPEKSALTGLRAQRDYAGQIIQRLTEMEDKYFGFCGQRHCGPDRSRQYREE
jgi:1-acyl-sn-glycerol-3-phosphate acyltransferase